MKVDLQYSFNLSVIAKIKQFYSCDKINVTFFTYEKNR